MAHLTPYPLSRLTSRLLRELDGPGPILDLPRSKLVRGPGPGRDFSVGLHSSRVATPLGPAAGPHTQLAQNIVLAYLGGCRVFELKTVQILDELAIPRPCIDARTVGFNVEWSQELKLEQSLEEYVKASMLLEVLIASGKLEVEPGFERFAFDMSVGYDLKGIQHPRVNAFLRGMLDATPVIDRLRAELPKPYRDLPFRTRISDTLTLSTFHGCPPGEIEGITRYLMEDVGLHCVVKLNPTLNGPTEARRLFNDVLGYRYRIPDAAFANDPTWEQAVALISRLEDTAKKTGRGLGVKFSNTLVVENPNEFLPASEKSVYLSGQPLHVLAMNLVRRFRETFCDRLPISFSAGIERVNFPDAVSMGLVPVTVCTDLLRPGGYGRLAPYFQELGSRMDLVGAKTIDEFVLKTSRLPGTDLAAARLENTRRYVSTLENSARYLASTNAKAPRKVGSKLVLFDCLTCDKCVPVCPNHANFTYALPPTTLPVVKLRRENGAWLREKGAPLVIEQKHQLANYADFCNECGNCDVFCPEDGGPYVLKPRFFGSEQTWAREPRGDGFLLLPDGTTRGRFHGHEYELAGTRFRGAGFDLELGSDEPKGEVAPGIEVDLTWFHILRWLRDSIREGPVNYVNA